MVVLHNCLLQFSRNECPLVPCVIYSFCWPCCLHAANYKNFPGT